MLKTNASMLGALRQSRRQALPGLSQLQLAAYKHSQGPVERSSDFQDGESLVGAYTPGALVCPGIAVALHLGNLERRALIDRCRF